MKTTHVPLDFGLSVDHPTSMITIAIVLVLVMALALGARRELTMFAVAAGVVGVMMAI